MLENTNLFEYIATNHRNHGHQSPWWQTENSKLRGCRSALRAALEEEQGLDLGPIGFLRFSYVEMGAISSLDLFGLDELILFSFYSRNRGRYHSVVDMGANIGLHSLILAKLGFSVTSYEPDPNHVALICWHSSQNDLEKRITVVQAAVAPTTGVLEFVRVLGNTTGSHVRGAKEHPYGRLEIFETDAVSVSDAIGGKDLVKMDVEGFEADLLTSLTPDQVSRTDFICEIGTPTNAEAVYQHFLSSGVNIFSQKIGWEPVTSSAQMPTSHNEGSVFISTASMMPW